MKTTRFTATTLSFLGYGLLLACAVAAPSAQAVDLERDDVRAFVDKMHAEYDFDKEFVRKTLVNAQTKESILQAISRPAEKTKPWHEYRKIFLTEKRISAGAKFWRDNASALTRASKASGVPAEIIVSIIGVETYYGRITGKYRVIDSLSTLAFDYPRRAEFFSSELENFFLLTREEDVDLLEVTGSYAGAMGAGQFMPSSYRLYAADGNADGARDLWNSWDDVFASIANYFIAHGWRTKQPAAVPARVSGHTDKKLASTALTPSYRIGFLRKQGVQFETSLSDDDVGSLIPYDGVAGPEYWVGFHNFYVVTRYNRSRMYALSVLQLADEIRQRVALEDN